MALASVYWDTGKAWTRPTDEVLPVRGRRTVCRVGDCCSRAVGDSSGLCSRHVFRLGREPDPKRGGQRGNELPDLRAPSFGGTAACAGKDTELWFPEPGELFTEAQAICHGCAVRTECFEYAIGDPSLKGVWAGTSERARARIRAERAQRALLEPAPVAS